MEPWLDRPPTAPRTPVATPLERAAVVPPFGVRLARGLPIAAILLLAAGLRLWAFDRVAGNAFYDAAVRSMSSSWHNLFFGAYDPAGMAAVDKAPVDLWLQVASVKLLGYGTVALRLPEALGGIAAVGLLYGLGRRLFDRASGLAAAAALAVLPASVLTARSDTMDSLMSALVVLAAWLIVRGAQAPPAARTRWIVAAGAALGVAFNVKLAEALIPLPALALLAWLALGSATTRRRGRTLLAGAAVFVAVALSWLVAVALAPGPKPFPIGSQDGTAWNVVLVFDGLARLGLAPSGAPAPSTAGGGPLVLFGEHSGAHLGALLGGELLAALLAGGAALAIARSRRVPRLSRAGIACVVTWLLSGIAALSLTVGLRTRYAEALAPAVALALGAAVLTLARAATGARRTGAVALAMLVATIALAAALAVLTARPAPLALGIAGLAALGSVALRRRPSGALAVVALVGLLAIPASTAARLAGAHSSDAGNPGGMPLRQLARLDGYLTTHRGHARYELAVAAAAKAGPLIARDGQPVLLLTSAYGIPLVSAEQLADDVEAGQVRYFLTGGAPCRPHRRHATGCAPAVRWAEAHGTAVSSHGKALRHLLRLRT